MNDGLSIPSFSRPVAHRDESAARSEGTEEQAFPIVGIGASAGGVTALRRFFEHLPAEPGMAILVVLHLSPDHESHLPDILQRHTSLPVQAATDGDVLECDAVYVIPSEHEMQVDGRQIHLSKPSAEQRSSTVDALFGSLAEEYGSRATGIVLSGTGADGTLGLRALKTAGGSAMVQTPSDAEHEVMPRNARQTGVIDLVLPADELAERLVAFHRNARSIRLPDPQSTLSPDQQTTLQAIFSELRARTGHDFSHYKRATVLRRLGRRFQVTGVDALDDYVQVLQDQPEEARALYKELLISVTRFFRTPEAFEALTDTVVPSLFEDPSPDDEVRVWVPGCATGEEAYSVAMLLHEQAAALDDAPDLQIFATDVDTEALATARNGVYPATIEADLTDERLARFFREEDEQYRVVPSLRDTVVFAEHNLIEDPPFSNLGFICCRNLLIYLDREMQQRVFRLFRYALNPDGFLFLGPSEAVGPAQPDFSVVEETRSILTMDPSEAEEGRQTPLFSAAGVPPKTSSNPVSTDDEPALEAVHRRLLAQQTASIIVDKNYEIVHLTEEAGQILQRKAGAPSQNLLDKVPPALRLELQGALYQAFQNGEKTTRRVPFSLPDHSAGSMKLTVHLVDDPEAERTLAQVRLDDGDSSIEGSDAEPASLDEVISAPDREQDLEEELEDTREQLRTTAEEYETVSEEMETANEELMSMNEELKAKNEELQTSKEQLQSVNEELTSTNQEFKAKVEALNRANSDLENLMEATEVGVLFLDTELCIRRFTPSVTEIFSLKESDEGRPLTDFTAKVDYDDLVGDLRRVLEEQVFLEREIEGDGRMWYLLRLRPYRTIDDEVEGVVLTFIDITAQKQTTEKLRRERDLISALVDTAGALIVVLDDDGSIVRFNTASERLSGLAAAEAKGQDVRDLLVAPEDRSTVTGCFEALAAGTTDRADFEVHWTTTEEPRLIAGSLTALRTEDGTLDHFILTGTDITDLRDLEREVVKISEQERLRIGEDLHDVISSGLTGAVMQVGALARRLDAGKSVEADELRDISVKIEEAGNQIRSLSHALVPNALREEGLAAALDNLATEESEFAEGECTFVGEPVDRRPTDEETALNLYRIAHEAVANAREHGNASEIGIDLQATGDDLVLTVRDDGDGWEGDQPSDEGLGLYLMRHRADLVGASLSLDHHDGQTTVECRLPLGSAETSDAGTE